MKKESLEKMVNKYSITAAQNYGLPNKAMLASLERYNKEVNAELLILPMNGKSVSEDELHPDLRNYNIVESNVNINKNIKISNYRIRAQQILPLTGIRRFAAGDKSFIFASPKIMLEYVANSYDKIPKAIMTTGACTEPNYKTSNRVGRIAQRDHRYGFVAVEKVSNSVFHFRQVPVLKNGKFVDLGMLYSGNKKPVKVNTKVLVVGDLHPYDTDKTHEKCTFEQIKYFKPEKVFLHDTFNGISISHHNLGKYVELQKIYDKQGLNLEDELKFTLKALTKYATAQAKHGGKVYVVASNHDEFLDRYINSGRFIGDKGNSMIGSKLYTAALEGKQALQEGLSLVGKVPDNVVFLRRDEDCKILGYQLANHGDLGANGGRGSVKSIEEANGKSITGHSHTGLIRRDTYKVGTSTKMRLGYNRGYSNWSQTNAVLYETGTVQLLNTIKKSWGK